MKKLILATIGPIFGFTLLFCLYATKPEIISRTGSYPVSVNQSIKKTKTTPRVATFSLHNEMNIQNTMTDLFTVAHDESVHAITIYINHSGGECGPYSALHDLIKAVRNKKPIIALITGSAYSAGYMIASAADYIICASGAGVGAIGTIWEIHKYNNTVAQYNGQEITDTVEVLTAGKYKGLENPLTAPLTSKTRKYLQAIVDENYQYFLKLVAANRNLSLETSELWAEGREFMAEKALALGLIDQIGTLFDVEKRIVEILRAQKPDIIWSNKIDFLPLETELAKK